MAIPITKTVVDGLHQLPAGAKIDSGADHHADPHNSVGRRLPKIVRQPHHAV